MTRLADRIADIRTYLPISGKEGGDYHGRTAGHWIVDSVISNPMSVYPEYKESRLSWGIDAIGGLVVEIETDGGLTGVGITHGGEAGAYLINKHFRRFLIGSDPRDVERIWDQLWRASLYYGRKGITLCAISAVDLALWDLCGKLRDEPVYMLLGGRTKEFIPCYVTGIREKRYQELGFIGAKIPLQYGPADGYEGLKKNVERFAAAREAVGPDFDLMIDCYMSLTVQYTIDLAEALRPYRIRWIEEPLPPDDYDGHARIKAACPWQQFTTGEHEFSRYGFRELISRQCVDILQPDLNWCGGITEARKIAAMAAAWDIPVVPHGSAFFSTHFQMAHTNSPFQETLAMSPDGMDFVSIYGNLFKGEPIPQDGKMQPPDLPGWGVELDRRLVRETTTGKPDAT
ncbi:L-rhamnonate dehydratase [soil metagenome]